MSYDVKWCSYSPSLIRVQYQVYSSTNNLPSCLLSACYPLPDLSWTLRAPINYTFTDGTKSYLSYSNFRIRSDTEQYPLIISGCEGVTSNPIAGSYSMNEMKFKTRDRDNDQKSGGSYAVHCHGDNAGVDQRLFRHTPQPSSVLQYLQHSPQW